MRRSEEGRLTTELTDESSDSEDSASRSYVKFFNFCFVSVRSGLVIES